MKWFKRGRGESNDQAFVNVLDTATQTVTRMPACELAPFMIQARLKGTEDIVWIDSRELQQSEYRHPPFPEAVREQLREIKSALDEFYCLSVEEWEDGFRRDTNPEKEIAIWLHLAATYRDLTTSRDLSVAQRQGYYKVLMTCLNSPREHVLHVLQPTEISIEEAKDVIAHYYDYASK